MQRKSEERNTGKTSNSMRQDKLNETRVLHTWERVSSIQNLKTINLWIFLISTQCSTRLTLGYLPYTTPTSSFSQSYILHKLCNEADAVTSAISWDSKTLLLWLQLLWWTIFSVNFGFKMFLNKRQTFLFRLQFWAILHTTPHPM